jgi:hypothetical protein
LMSLPKLSESIPVNFRQHLWRGQESMEQAHTTYPRLFQSKKC